MPAKVIHHLRVVSVIVCATVAMQAVAQEDEPTLEELVRQNAAKGISEVMARPDRPGQAEIAQPRRVNGGISVCATSDAYNRSGTYIGRDYWEVLLSEDGSEVVGTRNVTGTFSHCYGSDYAPFTELLEGQK